MLVFLEVLFMFIFLSFVATQVIYPLWRGTKVLPVLRREGFLLSMLRGEKQKNVEQEIEKQIKGERSK